MNQNVIITGATGRLGLEIAKFFAKNEDNLILVDIHLKNLKSLKKELNSSYPKIKISIFASDFTSLKQTENCVNLIANKFKELDILINNASITGDSNITGFRGSLNKVSQTSEAFSQVFSVGALAPFIMIRDLSQLMLGSKSACIINISSIYGLVGITTDLYQNEDDQPPAAYAAVKGAVISLTKYFATTLSPKIRVNCIAPGGILRNQSQSFKKKYAEKVPLKRMATEFDVIGAISWLVSPNSNYVNGQTIAVDGGWTIK